MKSAYLRRFLYATIALLVMTSVGWGQQPMAVGEEGAAPEEKGPEIVDVRELLPEGLEALDDETFVRVELVSYDNGEQEVIMTSETEQGAAPRRVSVGINVRQGTFKSTVQKLPAQNRSPAIRTRFTGTRCYWDWVESFVYDGPLMSIVVASVEWTYEQSTRCLLRDRAVSHCFAGSNNVTVAGCITGVLQNGNISIHVTGSGNFQKPGLGIVHTASIDSGPFVPTVAVSTSGVTQGNRDFLLMEHVINSIPTC